MKTIPLPLFMIIKIKILIILIIFYKYHYEDSDAKLCAACVAENKIQPHSFFVGGNSLQFHPNKCFENLNLKDNNPTDQLSYLHSEFTLVN